MRAHRPKPKPGELLTDCGGLRRLCKLLAFWVQPKLRSKLEDAGYRYNLQLIGEAQLRDEEGVDEREKAEALEQLSAHFEQKRRRTVFIYESVGVVGSLGTIIIIDWLLWLLWQLLN